MDKFFEISKRGSTVRTEIFAGLTTFFAMAYIIIVNPNQITGFSEGLGHIWNAVYVGSILVAVALVIFCLWRPMNALWGSALFGALLILYLRLPLPFLPTQIYKIVPYIATALVLIMVSMRQRREDQPPQGLGLNYFREDR